MRIVEQYDPGAEFATSLGKGINEGLDLLIQKKIQNMQPTPQLQPEEITSILTAVGFDPEEAQKYGSLYPLLSTGGQTSFANFLFDKLQRGQTGKEKIEEKFQEYISPEGPTNDLSQVDVEEKASFDFPEVDLFKGLTTKEKVAREKDIYAGNAKEYKEISDKEKGAADELRRISQLTKLNDSGKLPKGLGRINVNPSSGELILPFRANPETQLFIKLINDFTTKAKETFGARVTNFELNRFLKRLPSLNNDEGGRRLILKMLESGTALKRLQRDSLKQVYDHYGLRGIDPQKAEKIATKLRKDDEDRLINDTKESFLEQEKYVAKQNAPDGKIAVQSPDGKIGYVTKEQIKKARDQGYKLL